MKSADGRFEYLDKDYGALPDESNISMVGRFAFQCRMHPNNMCSVNVRNAGREVPNKTWTLTGTKDAPTLEPSINCKDCWHGYIMNGVFLKTDRATREPTQ